MCRISQGRHRLWFSAPALAFGTESASGADSRLRIRLSTSALTLTFGIDSRFLRRDWVPNPRFGAGGESRRGMVERRTVSETYKTATRGGS